MAGSRFLLLALLAAAAAGLLTLPGLLRGSDPPTLEPVRIKAPAERMDDRDSNRGHPRDRAKDPRRPRERVTVDDESAQAETGVTTPAPAVPAPVTPNGSTPSGGRADGGNGGGSPGGGSNPGPSQPAPPPAPAAVPPPAPVTVDDDDFDEDDGDEDSASD
jgi:hypothetical protein